MRALRLKTVVILLLTFAVSSAYAFLPGMEGMPIVAKVDGAFMSTSLETMKKILMLGRQGDAVAFERLMAGGVSNGTIRICGDKEKVFFIKNVDKTFIEVRPVGDPQTYFCIKNMFDYEDDNKSAGGGK